MPSTMRLKGIIFLIMLQNSFSWSIDQAMNRRQAVAITVAFPSLALADGETKTERYELRDRKSNKNALVREDYYYMMGKTPPRLLGGALQMDDPQFNAFGSCETKAEGSSTNSCTYVSLKQRIPAYSKYAFSIGFGAREFKELGEELKKCQATNSSRDWATAASYVTTLPQTPPPPPVDALLKMALFASSMLTSPNYSGPSRELLVARFYVNEASFATKEIASAIDARDADRALRAWDFGKDSWNSYFQIVNDKITAKVGDKFNLIE
eukprot:scaffold4903_cov125-Cylindrotheca_fusiformis.AAC.6